MTFILQSAVFRAKKVRFVSVRACWVGVSNTCTVNQSVVVSSFGSYADRWLYADKALGNNNPFILVVLYAKGLTDEQVKEAISQLQLNYCYSVYNTPKEIAFTVPVSF